MLMYLTQKKMIAERDRDGIFFEGISPRKTQKKIAKDLTANGELTDKGAPPAMESVYKSAQKVLKRNGYYIGDYLGKPKGLGKDLSDEESDDDEDTNESTEGSDSSDDELNRRYEHKKDRVSIPAVVDTPKEN
jgi:hypothetical protein